MYPNAALQALVFRGGAPGAVRGHGVAFAGVVGARPEAAEGLGGGEREGEDDELLDARHCCVVCDCCVLL